MYNALNQKYEKETRRGGGGVLWHYCPCSLSNTVVLSDGGIVTQEKPFYNPQFLEYLTDSNCLW